MQSRFSKEETRSNAEPRFVAPDRHSVGLHVTGHEDWVRTILAGRVEYGRNWASVPDGAFGPHRRPDRNL